MMLVSAAEVVDAAITLAWDASTDADVAGYRLYYGTPIGSFNQVTNVGLLTTASIAALTEGSTYNFFVTCYNTSGLESEPSNVVTVTIPIVEDANNAPEAVSTSVAVTSGLETAIPLKGSDVDGDHLSFTINSSPISGTLSSVTAHDGDTATVLYKSPPGFEGIDSFSFSVNDGRYISDSAMVFVEVTGGNHAPTAVSQSVYVLPGKTTSITLTGEDVDGDVLSYELSAFPQNGTLRHAPPKLQYTPSKDYVGSDSFAFTVTDGVYTSEPAEIRIIVSDTPDMNFAPVVEAGKDLLVTLPGHAYLRGQVGDDGLPGFSPTLQLEWRQIDGPQNGSRIENQHSLNTVIRFARPGTYAFELAASDGELTGRDALTIHTSVLSTALPSEQIVSLLLEAEAGELHSPMMASQDPDDDELRYISTTRDDAGHSTYSFTIPADGYYLTWCRVKTLSQHADSFMVYMDGDKSTRDIYDASEGEYDNAWKWTAVNGRGGEDREEEFAYTLSPRVFFFEEGRHSITFEGQEEGTRLDSILMTNDPWFDPRSAETSPAPTGLQVLAEGLVSLEWITMPGRSYQVAMKTTAGETDWTLLTDIMTATTTREQYVFLVTAPSGFYSLLMLP